MVLIVIETWFRKYNMKLKYYCFLSGDYIRDQWVTYLKLLQFVHSERNDADESEEWEHYGRMEFFLPYVEECLEFFDEKTGNEIKDVETGNKIEDETKDVESGKESEDETEDVRSGEKIDTDSDIENADMDKKIGSHHSGSSSDSDYIKSSDQSNEGSEESDFDNNDSKSVAAEGKSVKIYEFKLTARDRRLITEVQNHPLL